MSDALKDTRAALIKLREAQKRYVTFIDKHKDDPRKYLADYKTEREALGAAVGVAAEYADVILERYAE